MSRSWESARISAGIAWRYGFVVIHSILPYYYLFLPTNDLLPTKRESITARVGGSLKNMGIRIDANCLRVSHSIFPLPFNDRLMAQEIEFQGNTTHEASFQLDNLANSSRDILINTLLSTDFLSFTR